MSKKKKKIVGFIPARGGSKGIRRKNLADLYGLPLLAYTTIAAYSSILTEVWVSSNDSIILDTAKIYGANTLQRPENLCQDNSTTEEAVEHFLKHVKCDVVVLIQATSPLLTSGDIDRGIEKFLMGNYDSLFSVVRETDMLLWKFGKKRKSEKENIYIQPANYDPQDRMRRQTREKNAYMIESGGFFIFGQQFFNQNKCRMGGKVGFVEIPFWQSFQVDSYEDLANISKVMAHDK